MITTKIVKKGKGHDVYVNGHFAFWVIGSKKNAENELQTYLNKLERNKLKL